MGAEADAADGCIHCCAGALHGAEIALPFPSVGATENAILAATAAQGEVIIENAAMEPEIADLIGFLKSAGAQIDGAGTRRIRVRGGAPLHGATYTILPDRIETATYLCAAAACGGDVTLRILSGSENQEPEGILDDFARERGVNIEMEYQGSLDIMRTLQGETVDYDAVWPASSS